MGGWQQSPCSARRALVPGTGGSARRSGPTPGSDGRMSNPAAPNARDAVCPEWRPALAEFAESLEQSRRSSATIETYCRHVGWLAGQAAVEPWSLTHGHLKDWVDGHNWSAQTRRKVLVSIRAFYAWGIHNGLCERSP